MKDLNFSLLIDFYGNVLTDKQRDALELYYNQDLSLAEIAEHTSITRQGVRDNIKRGESVLLELEQKLGFYKKYYDLEERIESINNLVENIKDINKMHYRSSQITEFCDDVLSITEKYSEKE